VGLDWLRNFELSQIEVDECYFGARRVSGKRGRGTKEKLLFLVMI
jgi:hypothetical protein